jgi:hypothetical protein
MTGPPLVAARGTLGVRYNRFRNPLARLLERRYSIESFFASRPGLAEVQANREDGAFDTAG